MQRINKDAYGQKIYIDFNQNVSTATTFTATIQPQEGNEITSLTPTLETSDLRVGDQLYTANQYVSVTVTENLFDDYAPGIYRAKATATLSASEVISTDYDQTRIYVTE
jgi:DNA primase